MQVQGALGSGQGPRPVPAGGAGGQQLGAFGGQDPQHEVPVLVARALRVGFGGLGEAGPGQRGLPDPVEHLAVVRAAPRPGQAGIIEHVGPPAPPARRAGRRTRRGRRRGRRPGILSALMTRGSVRPWASSVVPATTNAMSTTCGRNGVSSGSDCAAATVITPRIPDQASTTPPRQPKLSDTKKSTSPIVRARCSARRSMRRAENRWLTSGSVTRRCTSPVPAGRRRPGWRRGAAPRRAGR